MDVPSCRFCGLVVLLISNCLASMPFKRFEYKLSFKGPHLVQKDASIPFWDYGGDAIASDDNIRITPSLRSKKGWVWSRNQMTYADWMIEVTFRVTGRGRIGADGLAIWYTTDRSQPGPVYGSKDMWNGLGVFMDSFDNDGVQNNPYILGVVNDGTKIYDHHKDGSSQMSGGCLRDFRNKPYPVKAKIEYNKEMLTVYIQNGMYAGETGYELCFTAAGVKLPRNGYFGVSAATGGLADDHDVISFMSYSYTYPEIEQGKDQFSEAERQKYEKEYQEYQDQLKQAREEYRKEHPDAKEDPYEGGEDKWYESQTEQELEQIYQGQNTILDQIRNIDRKLDEIVGRQERMLGAMAQYGQTGQINQQPQGGAQAGGFVNTMTRQEVDRLFQTHRDLSSNIESMRAVVNDISRRTGQVASGGGHNTGGGLGMNDQLVLHEIKDRVIQVKTDTGNLLARPQSGGQVACPPPVAVNCLSPVYFYVFIIGQIVIFIGYSIYRQNKEAQAKKFY